MDGTAPQIDVVVDTVYGPVRGIDDGTVKTWKGVRYAAPPVGDLRWRAPASPEPWRQVADATRFGAICPQPFNPALPMGPDPRKDEDCLFLNVWAASGAGPDDRRPVMVWVHGGGYIFGSSSQPIYDGRLLVADGDVVLVTVNYRLGGLGFLDLSSFGAFDSNLALRDVLLALRWVRDNIAAFGGDPDQVTLFGESAGGGIVTALLAAPAAAGLFTRAIAESSPVTSVYDAVRARRVAELVMDTLGVSDPAALRDVAAEAIVDASFHAFDAVPSQTPGTLAFAPSVDGDVLPDYPVKAAREGRTHPVPLIIGTNKDEAALFKLIKSPLLPITPQAIRSMFAEIAREQPGLPLPTEAQVRLAYSGLRPKAVGAAIARDVAFRMPTVWFAEGHSAVAPVYLYRFDWATPLLRLLRIGATHGTELPYVFGNLVMGPRDPTFKLGGLKQGRALSRRIQARWIGFAKSGAPDGRAGGPQWRQYRTSDRATMVFDKSDAMVDDLDQSLRATWGDEVLAFQ